jgi:hypothetical protein
VGAIMSYVYIKDGKETVVDRSEANADIIKKAMQLSKFKGDRREKLSESDWTQVSDAPLSSEEQSSWASYRQELRDMPEKEGFDPAALEWPKQPE